MRIKKVSRVERPKTNYSRRVFESVTNDYKVSKVSEAVGPFGYRVVFMTHLLFSTNSEYDTTWGDDISPTAVSDRFSEFVFTREVIPAIMKSLQGPDSQLLRSLDDYKPNIDGLGAFIDSEVVVDDSGESARLEVVASMSKVDADTLNKVKKYITGQYSDGFGEGYEQRPVYQIYDDIPFYDWEDDDYTTYPGDIYIHCHLWSRDGFEVFHKIEDTPDLLSESGKGETSTINKLKVEELREMAKEANVKNWKNLNKADLISELWVTRKYGLIFDYMEDYEVSFEIAQDMASE